jgi:hypothetical protein
LEFVESSTDNVTCAWKFAESAHNILLTLQFVGYSTDNSFDNIDIGNVSVGMKGIDAFEKYS